MFHCKVVYSKDICEFNPLCLPENHVCSVCKCNYIILKNSYWLIINNSQLSVCLHLLVPCEYYQ